MAFSGYSFPAVVKCSTSTAAPHSSPPTATGCVGLPLCSLPPPPPTNGLLPTGEASLSKWMPLFGNLGWSLTWYFSLVATDILGPQEVALLFQFYWPHCLKNLDQFPLGLVWRCCWITPQCFPSSPQRPSWCLRPAATFWRSTNAEWERCFPPAFLPFQVRQNLFFLCCLGLRILMLPLNFFVFLSQENSTPLGLGIIRPIVWIFRLSLISLCFPPQKER